MNKVKNSKRTLKENLAMIVRGYKILFQIYPKYIVWKIISSIINTAAPYFSFFMTSLIINELVSGRNIEKLFGLAGITVVGIFTISIIQQIIHGKVNVSSSLNWLLDEFYYLRVQNRMQYEHLENPDVTLLREDILAAKNATSSGIMKLLWNIDALVAAVINIILSVSLTVSLFTAVNVGSYTGFLDFVASPSPLHSSHKKLRKSRMIWQKTIQFTVL